MPRALRVEFAADPAANSGEEDSETDLLCQNSNVAICVRKPLLFKTPQRKWNHHSTKEPCDEPKTACGGEWALLAG
jgi:hypothetical protein